MTKTLFCYGYGYTAETLARQLHGWTIIGTTRSPERSDAMRDAGVVPVLLPAADISEHLARSTHLLVSAGPTETGDPLLHSADLSSTSFEWVGYLSTTGVYGDHRGDWVDETTDLNPSTRRGQWRVRAEQQWMDQDLPLHIFRLAGIYGPGRGPFAKVRNGVAQRIIKKDQVFSRIHVEDIARVLLASFASPQIGGVFNVCDNDPAPPQDVIGYAAELLGVPIPPAIPFEDADMSPMARSFYAENKRVRNTRILEELGVSLQFPSYREGLIDLLSHEQE